WKRRAGYHRSCFPTPAPQFLPPLRGFTFGLFSVPAPLFCHRGTAGVFRLKRSYLPIADRPTRFNHLLCAQQAMLTSEDPVARREAVSRAARTTRLHFRIRTSTLERIIEEGLKRDWPPLVEPASASPVCADVTETCPTSL